MFLLPCAGLLCTVCSYLVVYLNGQYRYLQSWRNKWTISSKQKEGSMILWFIPFKKFVLTIIDSGSWRCHLTLKRLKPCYGFFSLPHLKSCTQRLEQRWIETRLEIEKSLVNLITVWPTAVGNECRCEKSLAVHPNTFCFLLKIVCQSLGVEIFPCLSI